MLIRCSTTSATSSLAVRAPFLGDNLVWYVDNIILETLRLGLYVVDIVHGDVYSTRKGALKKMKGFVSKEWGYRRFHIRWEGDSYNISAHRFVWIAKYREKIPEDLVIDHINDIKTDNRIRNLRLIKPVENHWLNKAGEYYDKKETDNRD